MIANETLAAINKACIAKAKSPFRTHLGASVVAHECSLHSKLSFLWVSEDKFKDDEDHARLLRLWDRGDREEPVLINLLKSIGATVVAIDDETGEQFLFSEYGGHFGGQCDSIIWDIPDLPYLDEPILGEYKTHAKAQFNQLVKKRLQEACPKYYNQAQTYMQKFELDYCLHINVCKDTDRLHIEIIEYNEEHAERGNIIAFNSIFGKTLPPKISSKEGYYLCNMCNHQDFCHRGEVPIKSCRTCEYSESLETGHWRCKEPMMKGILDKEAQLKGCNQYKIKEILKV